MRSWQDWFPDGEVISSLVPQVCLYPNSEKDQRKSRINFDKEPDKEMFQIKLIFFKITFSKSSETSKTVFFQALD